MCIPQVQPRRPAVLPLHEYEKKGVEVEEIDPGVATLLPEGVRTARGVPRSDIQSAPKETRSNMHHFG